MMPDNPRIDRRQFAKGLVAGSSIVAAGSTSLVDSIAEDKPAEDGKKPEKPERAAEVPAPPAEELLLLNCLMQRYPSEHYDEAAMRGIYGDLRGDAARGRILSEFPLKNSDEPCVVFHPYRGPDQPNHDPLK